MKRLCLNEVRRSTNAVNLKQKKCFKFLMDCGFDFLNDFWGREITSSDHVEEFFKNHFFGVPSINSIFNLTLVEASEINFGKFVSCNVMNVSTTPSTDNGDNDDDYPEECSDEERTRRAYYRGFKDVSLLERFYRGMNGETE